MAGLLERRLLFITGKGGTGKTTVAVALAKVEGRPKQFFLEFCESLSQIMFKFVGLVMAFAPIGIGAATVKPSASA